jgi:SseB protein N-terminal domain
MADLTELAAAASTNDPRAVSAFAASFAGSRLLLPLVTLEGVKNRPETVEELGARLPVHRLRLDNGEIAIPLFSEPALCHRCAERLSWRTDGRGVKTLQLPGTAALAYASDVLVTPQLERVVLNPLSDGALHLARTDVESMVAGRELRHLWFYSRGGRLLRPVSIVGSSLLDTLLASADKALQRIADGGRLRLPDSTDSGEIFESLPLDGPLRGLAADLYLLVAARGFADLELNVDKSEGLVRVSATPELDRDLLERIRSAAERHLDSESGTMNASFRFRGRFDRGLLLELVTLGAAPRIDGRGATEGSSSSSSSSSSVWRGPPLYPARARAPRAPTGRRDLRPGSGATSISFSTSRSRSMTRASFLSWIASTFRVGEE